MGEITGTGQAVSGLGGAAGFGETAIARADESVTRVDVSAVFEQGFTLAGVTYAADALYISTDGLISFGAGVSGVQSGLGAIAAPFFAIFHADIDTRLDGEGAESGGIWLDVDPIADCVTITWDHVGFYRRNASLVNTFQIQLFDRGNGGFDLVFRYQDITWTSGDLQGGWGGLGGAAALIGLSTGPGGSVVTPPASGIEAALLALGQSLGNTGITGLWSWQFRQPSIITGTTLADTLAGTGLNDTLLGLAGDDLLRGSAGADVLNGGLGQDRADYGLAPAAIRLDLGLPANNLGQALGDQFLSIESFAGSAFADTLIGAGAADWLLGQAGHDLLLGGAASDTLYGGLGDDRLNGGAGHNRLLGEAGNDTLDSGAGNDSLYGGGGDDLLTAGEGQDQVLGGDGADVLHGLGGNDFLSGAGLADGADSLYGGAGADVLVGGTGNDLLSGGDGADLLQGEADQDLLFGGAGADTLVGGAASDDLRGGSENDQLQGGSGNDTLAGGDGADLLQGEGDADLLLGGAGDDWLWGGLGADDLRGGTENDSLSGGGGDDRLTGGTGADQFRHLGGSAEGSDLILDFAHSQGDRLWFGLAGATRADFLVESLLLPGLGQAGVADLRVTHIASGQVIWTIVDGSAEAAVLVQSTMNSFDLL